jgi:hypothetical protein
VLERFALTARWVRTIGVAAAALVVASVVGLVALPTGAASADDVVPEGARVVARAPVGGARVMVVAQGARRRLLVAYQRDDKWHKVEVAPPPARSAAAWAATRGGRGVPALSAVYGRTEADLVRVEWADGRDVADVKARPDGTFLVTRAGHVRSKSVTMLASDGTVLSTIEGP